VGWVSPEQIEAAKQIDIVDYLQRHEPENLKRAGNNIYTLRDHDSFVISNGKWCWNSRGFGCETGTALNYLIKVRGYDFPDAVKALTGDHYIQPPFLPQRTSAATVRRFILPPRNENHRRVIAYLRSRGIDRNLILSCISRGLLYEDAKNHNCVFTGNNEDGKTRFACVRSITGNYRGDVEGSDKRYGFLLPPKDPNSRNIACFEAPIDALSHMCIKGMEQWDGWRLSLSGGSLHALKHFLEHHPTADTVFICTDTDDAGQKTADRIFELTNDPRFKHITAKLYPPPIGNDWNDTLQALLKTERTTISNMRGEKYVRA
jgi:hypothetical protein